MVMGGELHAGGRWQRALSLAGVLLLACALALVVVAQREPSRPEERVSTKALSAKGPKSSASSASKTDGATQRAIEKIRKRMMKSLAAGGGVGGGKARRSAADRIRDAILKEESAVASLKLSSSNLFAKWERERTIAKDAQTKAVSLSEELQQDKTKLRMDKAKLTRETHALEKAEAQTPKAKGALSGESARTDLQAYFARLNAQDKAQEAAAHSRDAARGAGGAHAHAQAAIKGATVSLKGRPNGFDVLGHKTAEARDAAAEGLRATGAAANKLLLNAEAASEHVPKAASYR